MIVAADNRATVIDSLINWREKYLSQRQFVLLLSFFVGIFTSILAYLLKQFISWIASLLTAGFDATGSNWLFLVYPVVGIFLTALFIKYVVNDDIGHGVTKILYAISRRQGHIRRHNCWSSVIASGITIGFGGSVGAESPIVLTGSAIGSNLGRLFKVDHKTLMLLIGCGASGAIAGIFKAPIAGVVFTLEVLMIDLTMASLLPLLVSSITALVMMYIFTGTSAEFSFTLDNAFAVERIPTSILLGIFCGLVSLYFTRAMNFCEDVFRKFSNMYVKLLLGGSVLSVLIYVFPPLYGEGYGMISLLLEGTSMQDWQAVMNNSMFYGDQNMLLIYLGLIVLFKVFASSATNGGGGCGGIFAPCLFLGCISGFIFSRVWNINQLGVYVPEKNYALLGLAKKGQLLTHHKDKAALTLMSLNSVVERHDTKISPDMKLGEMVLLISREKVNVFPVTDGTGHLLGIIELQKIRKVLFRQELYNVFTAGQLMEKPVACLTIDDPMQVVMDTIEKTGADTLPVVDRDALFIGFVSKAKLYAMYRQVMVDYSEE